MDELKELLQRLTQAEELEGLDSDTLAEVAYWSGYLYASVDYQIGLREVPKGLKDLLGDLNV